VDEQPVIDRIESLIEEEHRLWRASAAGGLDRSERERLLAVRRELDGCWTVLRRRRAGAPDQLPRDSQVPDPPNELEGSEPEPPHLEHGVHTDEPSPDPDVPRDIP
jgi:Protein of unknown function (DUF2630)